MKAENSQSKTQNMQADLLSTPHGKFTSELIKEALLDNGSKSSLKTTEIMFSKEGETIKYDPITSTEEITKEYKCSFTIKRQVLKTAKKSVTPADCKTEDNNIDSHKEFSINKPKQPESTSNNLSIFKDGKEGLQAANKLLHTEVNLSKDVHQIPKNPLIDDKSTSNILNSFRNSGVPADSLSNINPKLEIEKHDNDELKRKAHGGNKNLSDYQKEMKELLEKKLDTQKQAINPINANSIPNIFSSSNNLAKLDQPINNSFINQKLNGPPPNDLKQVSTNIFQNTAVPIQKPNIFSSNSLSGEIQPNIFHNPFHQNITNKPTTGGLFSSITPQTSSMFTNPFNQKGQIESVNPFKALSTTPAPFKSIFDDKNADKAPFTNPEDEEEDGEKDIEELNKEIPIEANQPMANVKFEEIKKESTQVSKLPVEKFVILGLGKDTNKIENGNLFLESIKNIKLLIYRNSIGTILFQGVLKPEITTIELTNNKNAGTWALMVKGVLDLNSKSLKIIKFSISDIQAGEKYILNVFNPFLRAKPVN